MLIVDAQVHIWGANTPERPWPTARSAPHREQPFSKEDLLKEMDVAGVARVVIVPPSWEGDRNDLALAAAALAATLAAGSLVPALAVVLILYPACGFWLARFLFRRVIWVSVEPARRIGEAEQTMLLLWPVQGARFLRHLRGKTATAPEPIGS